jgi:mono/diheme cytochrome c family protein
MTRRLVLSLAALLLLGARGRDIYLRGEGVTAIVSGTEMSAGIVACANCHGPDGRGVPEGTVEPPDVRWASLSKPNVERMRPRYDDALLARAVTSGIDAGGNRLSAIMPRYRMSDDDMRALVSYLRSLGEGSDPGITDTSLRIATIIPPGPSGAATRAVLEGWFRDVNAAGGVHGRLLELSVLDTPRTPEAFAIVGAPSHFPELDDARIPVLTSLAIAPPEAPTTFSLFTDTRRIAKSAVPTLPTDITPLGLDELRFFATRHRIPPTHLPAQITAHATMKVFLEALKRAGRDLTREKFIAALETLYQFRTDLTPPITFSRNQHHGTKGAYVVEAGVGKWVATEDD